MSYERLNLKTGQVITEEVFAHLEDGIEGAANAVLMTPILYADLVALKDAGKLKAGMFYRITDYEATSGVGSVLCPNSLPFDVVVQAVSDHCLSVNAIGLTKFGSAPEILRIDYYLTAQEGPFFEWRLSESLLYYKMTEVDTDINVMDFINYIMPFNKASGDLQINGDLVIGENATYYVTEDGTIYTKTDSDYFGKGMPVSSKGLVARLRDSKGNDFPYDFYNITLKSMTDMDDLTNLPPGNVGIYPASIKTGSTRNVVVEPWFERGAFKIPTVRIMPFTASNVHVGKNCSNMLIYSEWEYPPYIRVGESCSDIKLANCSVGNYCDRLRLIGSFYLCRIGNYVSGLRIQGHFINLTLNDGCGRVISGMFCDIGCEFTTSDSARVANVTLDGPFETDSYLIKKEASSKALAPQTTIAADSNGVIKEFNMADLAN